MFFQCGSAVAGAREPCPFVSLCGGPGVNHLEGKIQRRNPNGHFHQRCCNSFGGGSHCKIQGCVSECFSNLPSRELKSPTWRKGNHLQECLAMGYINSQEGSLQDDSWLS